MTPQAHPSGENRGMGSLPEPPTIYAQPRRLRKIMNFTMQRWVSYGAHVLRL